MAWVEELWVEKPRLERGDVEGSAKVGFFGQSTEVLMVVSKIAGFRRS